MAKSGLSALRFALCGALLVVVQLAAAPVSQAANDTATTLKQFYEAGQNSDHLIYLPVKSGNNRTTLYVAGGISEGDYATFRQALNQAGSIDEVVLLNSPGGALDEGIEIGRMIRSRNLATHIPDIGFCASACNFIFMGGLLRTIDPAGEFMVHMFTGAEGKLKVLADAKSDDERKYVMQLIEQADATEAATIASFLVEMEIPLRFLTEFADIPNAEPKSLNRQQLREYNIINTD